jgi:hypothetical protein
MTPGAYQVSRIPFLLVLVTLCSFALPPRGHCQSFAQVLDLGSDVGARLTRAVTLNRINSSLFATPFAQVNWVDATGATPVVFSFATDCVFRLKSDTCFGGCRTPVSEHLGHPFRSMSDT